MTGILQKIASKLYEGEAVAGLVQQELDREIKPKDILGMSALRPRRW